MSASGRTAVSPRDLPASCPPRTQWDRHPRVYLPLSPAHPECACPYCGARYVLEGADSGAPSDFAASS